jgi:hypothetical protein
LADVGCLPVLETSATFNCSETLLDETQCTNVWTTDADDFATFVFKYLN